MAGLTLTLIPDGQAIFSEEDEAMKRGILVATILLSTAAPASAQRWVPWYQPSMLDQSEASRPQADRGDDSAPTRRSRGPGPKLLDGGGRPSIAPIPPKVVELPNTFAPGTIVIDTAGRRLFLIKSKTQAYRYPISVGREGFTWTGTEKISRVADWPDWYPPKEMRERDRSLPEKMTGGIRNPLGAKALYLGNSLYRIHGTNSAQTIGRANSSGCFRMLNGHVVDLARRVGVGTTVIVRRGLPAHLARARGDE